MVKPLSILEQMVDALPGWSYPVMLLGACVLSLTLAGLGMRVLMAMLHRAARSA